MAGVLERGVRIRRRRSGGRRGVKDGEPVRRRGRPPGPATGEETRNRILDAAVTLFSERGYGSTSVRDIAAEARIRVSTLYHYFRSKEEVYGEVRERGEAAIHALVLSCLDQNLPFNEMVRSVVERLFDYFVAHRHETRLSFAASLGQLGQREPGSMTQWLGFTEGFLRPAAARGEMKEMDPALFMISVCGILQWHVVSESLYQRLVGSDLANPQVVARARRHIVELIMRGMGIE
jgi:AcrR family transcriptional regulator